MRIAINTRFLIPGRLEGFGIYTYEIVRRIARDHPGDALDLCFDRPPAGQFRFATPVRTIHIPPAARHPFLFYIWYQWMLRLRLQTLHPDVFFSPDGFMPLGMKIPTVITIHDVAPLRFPEHMDFWQRQYYRHFMPRFAREAAHVITVSRFSKREIVSRLGVPDGKVTVVYNGVGDQFRPVNEEDRKHILKEFSGGKPYFLYVGAIHPRKNVAHILRAFDRFRQAHGGQQNLVVAGRKSWKFGDVEKTLAGLKYAGNVHMHGYVHGDDLPALIGSATALIYVSLYEGFGMPVVEAMACGTPVIASREGAIAEVAGDSALLVDPDSEEELVAAMSVMDQNPSARRQWSERGLKRAGLFDWDRCAEETYRILSAHT